ncbi:MAG: RNA polymerase sigma factor [Ruminococcaceae bacterium]|nr:RNA polymerase sigma factor [Oscillospiraceae bacterium]
MHKMHYFDCSDETLVMLTLAGEQNAYTALVDKYQRTVINSALAITKSGFMAEDAAQDAFVTAWIKLNTLREPSKFCGWVCRIARNCAINTLTRYRSFLPLDTVENLQFASDQTNDPEMLYALSEDKKELDDTIDRLPKKIKEIITLHYFEGLSIAEIADRMRISEGTVKSQLHDGRKRMRRELCAMNEKWNDTLVQKVMKKVEELKLWQVKNSKDGFDRVYRDVLREVEEMPESMDKNHALADVLMRGWWWLPGDKNDALFERISNAAIAGKNEDVMSFVVSREASQVSGEAKIAFIHDKQIPRLTELGFKKALAHEWFWLAREYYKAGQKENGDLAYGKVKELLHESEIFYALADNSRKLDTLAEDCKDKEKRRYYFNTSSAELRLIDNELRFWKFQSLGAGWFYTYENMINVFRLGTLCDGRFFDKTFKVGDVYTGTDGSKLTFVSDNESVETACGIFEGCQLWRTEHYEQYSGKSVCDTYYKDGIGIIRQKHRNYGITNTLTLKSYDIKSGGGLLPLGKGNSWEYALDVPTEYVSFGLKHEISYYSEDKIIVNSFADAERIKYDENSWADMMRQIRHEYCDHNDRLLDVSFAVERILALAKTPMEKAHTRAAVSTIRRIMETDAGFNPGRTQSGHWNFFHKDHTLYKNGAFITYEHSGNWSFEWKMGPWNNASYPMLFNDIYGILQDAANCIWSDEWQVGASPLVEYCLWGRRNIKTQIVCTNEDTVTTSAGDFENCLKLELDIAGMDDGWTYRGGKKTYWFADGIGIVKTANEYCGGARTAVYELTEYTGIGEGYMPCRDGLYRKYEAKGLTDGYVGKAEYTYVADEDGDVYIITERTGVRNIPDPVSCYSSIEGEITESKLWNEKKRDEARLRHEINNFNILLHYLGRTQRYYAAPKKALEWGRHSLKMIELLGEGGEVPKAWLGRYGEMFFRTACFIFGNKDADKDEGYSYLEKAFEIYLEWAEIPAGTPLDVGNADIYGGIKYLKDRSQILLPDGRIEAIEYGGILEYNARFIYTALTAKSGWEWFNSVRNEDRFKAFTEKVKLYRDKEVK